MENNKKLASEASKVTGGALALLRSNDYDRCPMCDNPTPIDSNGRCHCENCGHSWRAGSR